MEKNLERELQIGVEWRLGGKITSISTDIKDSQGLAVLSLSGHPPFASIP